MKRSFNIYLIIGIIVMLVLGVELFRYLVDFTPENYTKDDYKLVGGGVFILFCAIVISLLLIRYSKIKVLGKGLFLLVCMISCMTIYGLQSNIDAQKKQSATLDDIRRHRVENLEQEIAENNKKIEDLNKQLHSDRSSSANTTPNSKTTIPNKPNTVGDNFAGGKFATKISDLIDKATKEMENENYSSAFKYFNQINEYLGGNNLDCIQYMLQCIVNTGDYETGFPIIKRGAELGDINCQAILGLCYEMGQGTQKDISQAIDWYEKAAIQGHTSTMIVLAFLYYDTNNLQKAKMWIEIGRKASEDIANDKEVSKFLERINLELKR